MQAQAFDTGAHAAGYTVSEVQLWILRGSATTETSVKIREDDDGEPGDLVATLTNPEMFSGDSLHTFTAPEGTTLNASTTYWISVNEGIFGLVANYRRTNSDGETGETRSRAWGSRGDERLGSDTP